MSYFQKHYRTIRYPIADTETEGLYNAQIGAIHAIGSHFTINEEPAIITMPTGSGKTAVLMVTPFILHSERVLVITPSRMVRDQIREDFEELKTLKDIGVVRQGLALPSICEVKSRIDSVEKWGSLRNYDVVISTPNCTSPAFECIPKPPEDLFDLILIDEAHHSPAKTWDGLLKSFPHVKRVLFTATPFRRDRREIRGRFIYTYPLARAYEDKIFGRIRYIPVNEKDLSIDNDIALAQKAEVVFKEDKSNGLKHFLMVRTDIRKRADQLAEIYREHTSLKLQVVHSGHSYKRAKEAVRKLNDGELDGIICVNMLGEGFNFPNLKIAAIHVPHKSLEVTLQFIGRFARTNTQDIGEAKFLAVPSEIEIEGKRLFDEAAVWQDAVIGLNQIRTDEEVDTREELRKFDNPLALASEIKDLSLYSLRPRNHVKIYRVSTDVDIGTEIELKPPFEVFYMNVNRESSAAVIISREITAPRWSRVDKLLDVKYDLFVVYYNKQNQLLFINSSRSIDGLYENISKAFDPNARGLPTSMVNKVLKGLTNTNFFNIGMRNIIQTNNTETYRIIAGSSTQGAVKESDGRLYRQGHAFCTAEEAGRRVSIGFSSASKIWTGSSSQIPKLIRWCKEIVEKIKSSGGVRTNSGLDYLAAGEVADQIPEGIISADWNKDAYDYNSPVEAYYQLDDGRSMQCHISDLDLVIDKENSSKEKIRLSVQAEGINYPLEFSLESFFVPVDRAKDEITLMRGERQFSIVDYMNEHPINFYTSDFSLFTGNELFIFKKEGIIFDVSRVERLDWQDVDIERECESRMGSAKSIHEFMREYLTKDSDNRVIFYDHGPGELADYLTIREQGDSMTFQLYHCKSSGGPRPGSRVDDLYEVCGQAQKSLIWALPRRLCRKVLSRNRPGKFYRGSLKIFNQMIDQSKSKRKEFEIIIVQPGISCSQISESVRENLGATSAFVTNAGCKLRVMGSD